MKVYRYIFEKGYQGYTTNKNVDIAIDGLKKMGVEEHEVTEKEKDMLIANPKLHPEEVKGIIKQ